MNEILFEHDFRTGIGPFVTRTAGGQDLPSSDAAVHISPVQGLKLSLLTDPLRTGHVWNPNFSFVEGFVEFTMKFPAPEGVHSSGWLQSITPYAGNDDHEIDVGEHFGNEKVVHHSVWKGPWNAPEQVYKSSARLNATRWAKYGVDCRKGGYTFTINGVEVGRVRRIDTGLRSTRPKNLIISLLSDDWERGKVDFGKLENYYMLCRQITVTESMGW